MCLGRDAQFVQLWLLQFHIAREGSFGHASRFGQLRFVHSSIHVVNKILKGLIMCFSYAGHLLKIRGEFFVHLPWNLRKFQSNSLLILKCREMPILSTCKDTKNNPPVQANAQIFSLNGRGVPAYRRTAIPFHIFVHHNLPYDIIYYYIYYNIYNNI